MVNVAAATGHIDIARRCFYMKPSPGDASSLAIRFLRLVLQQLHSAAVPPSRRVVHCPTPAKSVQAHMGERSNGHIRMVARAPSREDRPASVEKITDFLRYTKGRAPRFRFLSRRYSVAPQMQGRVSMLCFPLFPQRLWLSAARSKVHLRLS